MAPEILEAVREFRANGGRYDDQALAFVADRLGIEPTHDLSRDCYHAKNALTDEDAQSKLDEFIAAGFATAADSSLAAGGRYEVRRSTLYVGRNVPDYGAATACRAIETANGRLMMLPGRNRTHGFYPATADIVREIAAKREP